MDIYATTSNLYVLNNFSITAFDANTFIKRGRLELAPYYDEQFGPPGPYLKIGFIDHEFDWKNDTFYLRGRSSTFYEVKFIYH